MGFFSSVCKTLF
jgi:hypothetical protein